MSQLTLLTATTLFDKTAINPTSDGLKKMYAKALFHKDLTLANCTDQNI
jgi:hypothetical protein